MDLNSPTQAPTHAAVLAAIPQLRAYALSLCRNSDQANDLVQEALLRACANIDRFEAGSSMIAWLMVILRNQYFSEHRKRRREVEDVDGIYAQSLIAEPTQIAHLNSATSAPPSPSCRMNCGTPSFWLLSMVFPTKRPPRPAAAPSVRSRAAFIGRGRTLPQRYRERLSIVAPAPTIG